MDSILEIDDLRNVTLDGELYNHGMPLQTITSLVKRRQAETAGIKYYIYDVMMDATYKERLNFLTSIAWPKGVVVADTWVVNNDDEMQNKFSESRAYGYEGGILRVGSKGYQDGKRSNSLLKVKKRFDTECKVIDIKPSVDGWARLMCLFNGKTFWVSAPGTMVEKRRVMERASDYLGAYVKIEYADTTRDGVPFHPVATHWVDDISI